MKRFLPIGIQNFAQIRENGAIYVDKTARIHQLLSGSMPGQPFFLSRPRRFGKSLLCSTLSALFEGRRELFGEIAGRPALAINSLDWGWEKHPVIRLDLNPGNYLNGVSELHNILSYEVRMQARKHGIELEFTDIISQFKELIQKAAENYCKKAVVIIDEYDKPLTSTIVNREVHESLRNVLKGFYGVLKSSGEHLQFLFLTGVTKFSRVSVFSDLNHLIDLSLDPRYADICGLTQEEIEANFAPEITTVLKKTGNNREKYMDDLRKYYNGYRFSEKPLKVYNPWGLLNHFDKSGKFLPYWYETGTPSLLIKLITEQKIDILDLNKMRVGFDDFCNYDADNMKAEPILYQSGYLTIIDYDEDDEEFVLDYPNIEVRSAFSKYLIEHYLHTPDRTSRPLISKLPKALRAGDIEEAINALRQFLASIPYDIIKEKENYYQTAIHLIFSMLGLSCRSEVRIAAGRIDTLVETKNFVYCFEFKLDATADEALAQIDTKEYLLPWEGSGKKLFKAGVNICSEKRNIDDWKYVAVEL